MEPAGRPRVQGRGRTKRPGRRLSTRGKLSLLFLAALLIALLLWLLPAFRIRQIEVRGNGWLPEHLIKNELESLVGRHGWRGVSGNLGEVLTGRYGRTEKAFLDRYPSLLACRIQFRLPATLRVDVELKEPRFLAAVGDAFYTLDEEGRLARALSAEELDLLTATDDEQKAIVGQETAEEEVAADQETTAESVKTAAAEQAVRYIHLYPRRNQTADCRWDRSVRVGELLDSSLPQTLRWYRQVENLLQQSDEAAADGLVLAGHTVAVRPGDAGPDINLDLTGEPGISDAAAAVIRDVGICFDLNQASLPEELTWLRYAIRSGALNDLGSGQLHLNRAQRVFVPNRLLPETFATDADGEQKNKTGETESKADETEVTAEQVTTAQPTAESE